jgi:glycosyltransferase involved in cell wall biosynthesis
MLSVVIATHDHERALLPTLAALVPGAVAGVVHEVIVADAGSSDATAQIAEAAGCRILASKEGRGARLKAAAAVARAQWLLFVWPGFVPDSNWIDQVTRFVEDTERPGRSTAAILIARSPVVRPTVSGMLALLRAVLSPTPDAQQAMLVAKAHYDAIGGHLDVDAPERDLIRRVGRRHLVRFPG